MIRWTIACGLATLCSWPTTNAYPNADEASLDLQQIKQMASKATDGKSKEKKPPFPKFEEVTKDMKSQKGLFTLWSYPASAKDKDSEKLLCQIPTSFLGQKFMLSVSFSGGGSFTGYPLGESVVQWEMVDKQLLLIEPETHFIVDTKKTVSDVVRRTYPERIRAALPIVTKSSSGDPVIDLGRMLKSNFADVAWMSRRFSSRGGAGGVNSKLSRWTKKKAFELNVEIGVALAMGRSSPPGSYDKKMVHFSFWKLPKSDYKPRVADDRVGYFLTANQDWSKPTESRDIFNRYIDRWHLEKRDPSLTVCEPKQPIIFYIEKTVPVRFRRAVRDGILEWNKAYEKIGFVNAVEVRQQTGDNEWKDLDPEDMRYSFFRWIVSGRGFAMGPHRANPFTGQIYDADIIFDDSMVRYYERSAGINLSEYIMNSKQKDPVLRKFFDLHPEWKRPKNEWNSFVFGEPEEDSEALRDAMRGRMRQRGIVGCDYYEGMKQQMTMAYSTLAGQPKEVIDKFLYDIIKEIVMHEVGHTLGLRHNFKASTIYTLDQIKNKRKTGEATVGSVMDYNPILFVKGDLSEGHFITPTIGPYDYWAIEYGYRPADGSYKPAQPSAADQKEDGNTEKDVTVTSATDADKKYDIPKDLLAKLPSDVQEMIAKHVKSGSSGDKEDQPDKNGSKTHKSSSGEKGMLEAIAARAGEHDLAYATDEDTTIVSPDPRSNRFDMSAEPIDWARERIDLINDRIASLLEWSVKEGESWYHARSAFQSLFFEKARVLGFVGRYIGGQYTNRSHRGDVGGTPPFTPVEADIQRRALGFIEENLYDDAFFDVSPELLNHLAVSRWSHAGARVNYVGDYPIHDMISSVQWSSLLGRLFPNTLRRLHDAELKTDDPNKLTLAEYIQRLQKACWGAVLDGKKARGSSYSDTKPYLSSIRRSLQREHLNFMELLLRYRPGSLVSPDIHAMLQHSLRKLKVGIVSSVTSGKLDFGSEAHLVACQSRIEHLLDMDLEEF